MFDAIRRNQRITQIILAIIVIPFALFGIDAYFRAGPGGSEIATVGKSKITMMEFDQALRAQQERWRNAMGERFDRSMVESEMFRRSVLENLINERVLAMEARDQHLAVTQEQVFNQIYNDPMFQQDGVFSSQRYEALLRSNGYSPVMYEQMVMQDMRLQQLLGAVRGSSFASKAASKRYLTAQNETREVREITISPKDFLEQATLAEDAAQQYYDQNIVRFEEPARLRAEYVVLDEAARADSIDISEEQVKQYYESNLSRFTTPEQRRARHILFEVAEDASEEQVAEAQRKAEELVAILRETPERFEELAREHSQDPGSADAGGDLGFFGRNEMVGPFSDKAFSLAENEISDPLRSEFGFHIIEVTGIRPEAAESLDEAHDVIVADLRRQEYNRQYPILADDFSSEAFNQPDTLKSVAETLGLKIQTTDWVTRNGAIGPYRNPKLMEALFSDDAIKGGNNTEAVEVGRGIMVAARVVEYEDAKTKPFDEVREQIEKQLRDEEARRLAKEKGEALLKALQAGNETEAQWGEARTLTRREPMGPESLNAVFNASAANLPTVVGVSQPDGSYALFEIQQVNRSEPAGDDEQLQTTEDQFSSLFANYDSEAYLRALRTRYKIQIRASALKSEPQPD